MTGQRDLQAWLNSSWFQEKKFMVIPIGIARRNPDSMKKPNRPCIKIPLKLKAAVESSQENEAGWADLPPELLQIIARKRTNICDHIRLRSVCARWHSVVSPMDLIHPQLPWLVISHQEATLSFLNPCDARLYSLVVPETQGKWIFGSSHGWLVIIDPFVKLQLGHAVSLLNPITQAKILLPRLPIGFWLSTRSKVVSYFDPTTHIRQVLVAAHEHEKLVLIRKGDDKWTVIDNYALEDMVCFKEELYTINGVGRTSVVDIASLTLRPVTYAYPQIMEKLDYHNLVVTSGNLLLVAREFQKLRYRVLKLVKSSGETKWTTAGDDIEDTTFFVSHTQSVGICAKSVPDGRANQINLTGVYEFPAQYSDVFRILPPGTTETYLQVLDLVGGVCTEDSLRWVERPLTMPLLTWMVPSLVALV